MVASASSIRSEAVKRMASASSPAEPGTRAGVGSVRTEEKMQTSHSKEWERPHPQEMRRVCGAQRQG